MTASDRRTSPRTAVLRPGVLSVPVEDGHFRPYKVTVLDTSEGGCRVRISIRVDTGTPVRLRMEDSGLMLQGVVRYVHQPFDTEEFHLGIQYFHPEDPIEETATAASSASELMTLLDIHGVEVGSVEVRVVKDSPDTVVAIAPRFIYPDTEIRLRMATATVVGYTGRCGAAIGGYRVTIAVKRREFRWTSLATNPLNAARFALQSIRPVKKPDEKPEKK